jgi:molybdopterin synthase sulfur carrier subunit
MPTATRTIHIRYFALLRDQRGLDEEATATDAATPRELYDALRAQHGFTIEREHLRVAVNDRFVAWDAALRAGDRVVFIPPVAGG